MLLDDRLPRRSGVAVARALKGDPDTRGIKVILLQIDQPSEQRRADVRADAYFIRPFNPRELLATVRALLAAPEAGRTAAAT